MSDIKPIDYTKMRRSKSIQACPKCGRKGRVHELPIPKGKTIFMYVHKAELVITESFAMESIQEKCFCDTPSEDKR